VRSGIDGGGLAGRLAADLSALDAELSEIDLLISQATAESERHEQKRASAAERLGAAQAGGEGGAHVLDQATALIGLTRRAAVMEAQVDVLSGKRKVLGRYRDALAAYVEALESGPGAEGLPEAAARGQGRESGPGSRMVLAAQEELRREIARAMHDGPAQSLTNIVLQAQIVERIVDRDPVAARAEVRQLIDMVQRTLDATKSFIFEVRPMVLDDLGLVPTLRGAARDRARRTGIAIAFESFGPDRRLPRDLESGLFRLLDDALAAFVALQPTKMDLRLDWGDQLEARITATAPETAPDSPAGTDVPGEPVPAAVSAKEDARSRRADRGRREKAEELPPALAQMIAQRRDDEIEARALASRAREIKLPAGAWEDLRARAESLSLRAELLDGGSTVQVTVDLPALAPVPAAT
jgi:two-component system sensor histidine kinase DegS